MSINAPAESVVLHGVWMGHFCPVPTAQPPDGVPSPPHPLSGLSDHRAQCPPPLGDSRALKMRRLLCARASARGPGPACHPHVGPPILVQPISDSPHNLPPRDSPRKSMGLGPETVGSRRGSGSSQVRRSPHCALCKGQSLCLESMSPSAGSLISLGWCEVTSTFNPEGLCWPAPGTRSPE